MATIHIDVEGFEPFEFDIEDHMTAGAIGSTIRTACGLFRGSVRRDLRAFGEDRVLEPGYTHLRDSLEKVNILTFHSFHPCFP